MAIPTIGLQVTTPRGTGEIIGFSPSKNIIVRIPDPTKATYAKYKNSAFFEATFGAGEIKTTKGESLVDLEIKKPKPVLPPPISPKPQLFTPAVQPANILQSFSKAMNILPSAAQKTYTPAVLPPPRAPPPVVQKPLYSPVTNTSMAFPLAAIAGQAIGGLASGIGGALGLTPQGGRGGGVRGGTVEGRSRGYLIVNVGGRRVFVKTAKRRRYAPRRRATNYEKQQMQFQNMLMMSMMKK